MAWAVSRKHSAVSKRVSNGPCKSQWSSSPFCLRASVLNVCDFQNSPEPSKKLISSHSLSWYSSPPPPPPFTTGISTQFLAEWKKNTLLSSIQNLAHRLEREKDSYCYFSYILLWHITTMITGATASYPDIFLESEYLDISGNSITTENWHNSFIYMT